MSAIYKVDNKKAKTLAILRIVYIGHISYNITIENGTEHNKRTSQEAGRERHMELKEAKLQIAKEFIDKYLEWLNDYNNHEMPERDYNWKYGWGKGSPEMKDTQKSMLWFRGHIYSGKYTWSWKEAGIDRCTLVELHRAGFLSYDYCSSYRARMLGKTDFYYISQNKAKEIYKAYKSGFFAEA